MRPLKLPILFLSEEQYDLSELGVELNEEDHDTREMTFYQIAALAPRLKHWETHCLVYTGNDCFVCTKPYKEVQRLIEYNL